MSFRILFVPWSLSAFRPQANTGEVKDLRAEASALKELMADLSLENRLLKNLSGAGGDQE